MTRLAWLFFVLALFAPETAAASGCSPVARAPARAWFVRASELPAGVVVRLTFLGHASFLIETAGGASAVTDYNAYVVPPYPPRIATMNNAHDTHYTDRPDPRIEHVLRGWNPQGGWAEHDLVVADLRVRNVPTAVHGRFGTQALSNSIFVFEVADLCIAHLGHLHHLLTPEQRAELGEIDVLLAPVDGTYTMSQEEMLEVIEQIRPEVVIPMHYFGPTVLGRFLALAQARGWRIEHRAEPVLDLSRDRLPHRTVVVLPGR
ncbi:MAG: MBL fold metallo-hydrolase [Geminicoccaceae bacterium]|nr:MBL fold metallo-hydrolase [Geminicoccaceae bacterium]MCS7267918.1 MBL fold metallo-hydrolase [Geminicoccaceae bacterium]MCX7631408.1 MBL fold metallo-hydrolase [Geminicoccaceae bacterium]MDW8124452.1 MBL fold metallo-hydrolase [Geminicoccaceae bacterium]MDW8342483.1 MBL fold metallo-hydrolase [Geminicoccaceae bacterium]